MIAIAISVYIVGLFIFYVWGQLNSNWYEWYYFWDKLKDLLLFMGLHSIVPAQYKQGVFFVIIFSTIRLIWQIISSFTGANINNTEIIGWLFIVLAFLTALMILKGFIRWRK